MKLLHLSDLHIGKKVKGFSLFNDQKYILDQIIDIAKEKSVDGIIIAGDIYDVSSPSNDAVRCFDDFISRIHSEGIACYVVSGNHDSIYRVSFGADIMSKENVHFAKSYSGKIEPIHADKNTDIWLLPFIRPVDVRDYHPDFAVGSYDEMMQVVLKNIKIDNKKTNILVAHQFITNSGKSPQTCDSETVSVGTMDNIDVSNFDKFDYVALGHIHRPQSIGRETVRYAGSPLKYSFSEKNDKKSMVIIDTSKKKIKIETIEFKPIRDLNEYSGTLEELLKHEKTDNYAGIILKDKKIISDVKHKLESTFLNIMEIKYENAFTEKNNIIDSTKILERQNPVELFNSFYELQNNEKLNKEELKIVKDIFEKLEEPA